MTIDSSYFDEDYFGGKGLKTTASEMIQGRPHDPVAEGIAEWLMRCVPGVEKESKTLEFGCGRGTVVDALRNKGVKAWGFDASVHAVTGASSYIWKGDATEGWTGDPEVLGIRDLVYSIEVLEHIPADKLHVVLSEAFKALKKGGYLVCSVATAEDLERVEKILEKHPEQRDDSHVTCLSWSQWNETAGVEGFHLDLDLQVALRSTLIPIPCSPYHSRVDRDEDWAPLDDSPFEMFGRFAWSTLAYRKPL